MSASTKDVVQQLAPWRAGIGWPVVALQAAIFGVLGIFLLLAPDTAQSTARALIGLILLVRAIHVTLDELAATEHPQPASTIRMLGTGASLATGVIVVLQPFAENLSGRGATTILATGLLIMGIVDLIGFLLGRKGEGGVRWADLLKPVVTIGLALALYYNLRNDRLDFTLIGWVLLVLGAFLGAYAYLIYRGTLGGATTTEQAVVGYEESAGDVPVATAPEEAFYEAPDPDLPGAGTAEPLPAQAVHDPEPPAEAVQDPAEDEEGC